jgi:hypothetical protein
MLRRLSREEIESILAGDKPGVNKELARRVLAWIHAYKFRPTALMVIQMMKELKFCNCNQETGRILERGVDVATVKS